MRTLIHAAVPDEHDKLPWGVGLTIIMVASLACWAVIIWAISLMV